MFNKEMEVEFEMDSEEPLTIEAVIEGQYMRATHWQPAEYPTVDSVRVMFGRIDVTSEIGSKEMERIKEQAMERCKEEAYEAESYRRHG